MSSAGTEGGELSHVSSSDGLDSSSPPSSCFSRPLFLDLLGPAEL